METQRSAVPPSVRFWKYWVPVLVVLISQFAFSTDVFSRDHTAKFVLPVILYLMPKATIDQLSFWHQVVRKSAHVTEYCFLGILSYRAFMVEMRNDKARARMLTVVFLASVALFDEFHQSFIPSRGASMIDVGYDFMGGLFGLLLIWAWRNSRVAQG